MKADNKALYKVYTENGMNFVLLPDGTRMPSIIRTIVEDGVNDFSRVTIEVECYLYSTKEEALSNIENKLPSDDEICDEAESIAHNYFVMQKGHYQGLEEGAKRMAYWLMKRLNR